MSAVPAMNSFGTGYAWHMPWPQQAAAGVVAEAFGLAEAVCQSRLSYRYDHHCGDRNPPSCCPVGWMDLLLPTHTFGLMLKLKERWGVLGWPALLCRVLLAALILGKCTMRPCLASSASVWVEGCML